MLLKSLLTAGLVLVMNKPTTATLVIDAPDTMSFLTLNFPHTTSFTGPQTFKLPPGEYVVVQAPPVEFLRITCDDGSPFLHQLAAGQVVHCLYSPL